MKAKIIVRNNDRTFSKAERLIPKPDYDVAELAKLGLKTKALAATVLYTTLEAKLAAFDAVIAHYCKKP